MSDFRVALALLASVSGLLVFGIFAFWAAWRLVERAKSVDKEARQRLDDDVSDKKLLVIQEADRRCRNCDHFDLDLGQKTIASNPVFFAATRHVSPNRMGSPLAVDEKGDPLPIQQQPKGPLSIREDNWDFFGACVKQEVLVHRTDTCEHFTPKAAQLAPERMV